MLLGWASSLVSGGGGDGGVAHLRQVDPFAIAIGTQAGSWALPRVTGESARSHSVTSRDWMDAWDRAADSDSMYSHTMIQLHAYAYLDGGSPNARVVLDRNHQVGACYRLRAVLERFITRS